MCEIKNVVDFCCDINVSKRMSDSIYEKNKEVVKGGYSRWNDAWIIPANLLLGIAQIVLAPLVSLITFITAAVFKLYSLFSSNEKDPEFAKMAFVLAIYAITDGPLEVFARILDPEYDSNDSIVTFFGYDG